MGLRWPRARDTLTVDLQSPDGETTVSCGFRPPSWWYLLWTPGDQPTLLECSFPLSLSAVTVACPSLSWDSSPDAAGVQTNRCVGVTQTKGLSRLSPSASPSGPKPAIFPSCNFLVRESWKKMCVKSQLRGPGPPPSISIRRLPGWIVRSGQGGLTPPTRPQGLVNLLEEMFFHGPWGGGVRFLLSHRQQPLSEERPGPTLGTASARTTLGHPPSEPTDSRVPDRVPFVFTASVSSPRPAERRL